MRCTMFYSRRRRRGVRLRSGVRTSSARGGERGKTGVASTASTDRLLSLLVVTSVRDTDWRNDPVARWI